METNNNVVVTVEAIETTSEQNLPSVVNPLEFGLEVVKAKSIEQSFLPKVAEIEGYTSVYQNIITKEVSQEVCSEARDLRLKLVKVRTGIANIHKSEKAYYLAAGKFCDAIKNKLTEPVEQMEEQLEGLEKHFEKIEAERKQKIKQERIQLLTPYEVDCTFIDLINMPEEQFNGFLENAKMAYEKKIEEQKKAELERIENERLDNLERERLTEISKYSKFITEKINLRNSTVEEYDAYLESLKVAENAYELEQEKIRQENERLRAEAEEKERQLIIERQKSDAERKRVEAEAQAKLKAEQDAKAKLEAELQAKKDAEAKAERERIDAELKAKKEAEKLAKAPIKKQLTVWVDSFEIQGAPVENDIAVDIQVKFAAFKKWAKTEIEKM
jgi:colicin import membrane protein